MAFQIFQLLYFFDTTLTCWEVMILPPLSCFSVSPILSTSKYLRLNATVLNLSAVTWSNRSYTCVSVSVTGRLRNWAKSSTPRWSPSSFLARLASSSNTSSVVFALSLLIHRHDIMLLWHIQSQGRRHAWHIPQRYLSPWFLVGCNHPKHNHLNTFPK